VAKVIGSPEVRVLLLGESGTGKELLARAIHQLGSGEDRPMVSVNLAEIPGTLIEAALFGHERGHSLTLASCDEDFSSKYGMEPCSWMRSANSIRSFRSSCFGSCKSGNFVASVRAQRCPSKLVSFVQQTAI
jgi:hypothetical protein